MTAAEPDPFEVRFSEREDELRWLYMELYRGDAGAFEYFRRMLRRCFDARREKLREWDDARNIDKDWYRDNGMIGMTMYTECFGGDLRGVMDKTDYLRELGVRYLHLMPLFRSPEGKSDGGYAISDFGQVEPRLGTMEDLAKLTKTCHSSGIAVCLDFVMNHTSDEHEWARRAKAGEKEFQDRYFFYDTWDIPNEFEKTVPQVFPQTAPGNFSWCPEAGKVVMTTFHPYQWDLNYANPTVFNDMTEAMLNICNHGVDIIRLDAVPYIWKQIGTSCRNLPQVHTLVRMIRLAVEIVCPGTLLLGEVVMQPEKVVPYFGTVEKPECHMLYNVTTMASTWHTVATRDVRLLEHQLRTVFSLPVKFTFQNYLRCHDDIGWGLDYGFLGQFGTDERMHKQYLNDYLSGKWPGSDARGELYNDDPRLGDARMCGTTASLCGIEAGEFERDDAKIRAGIRLDIMLHAFLLTQRGVPVLYSGDEIGQLNDYTYHDDPLKRDDSRYLHRGAFRQDEAEQRDDPDSRPGMIFSALKKMIAIRSMNDVFLNEADTWVIDIDNTHVLGIGRYLKGEKLLALFNFGDFDETVYIDGDGADVLTDLMTGEKVASGEISVRSRDFLWLYYDYRRDER